MQNGQHGGEVYRYCRENDIPLKDIIDLSANINPFGPSEKVCRAATEEIVNIKHYPDARKRRLTEAAAGYLGLPSECLLFGNGASEILFNLFRFLASGKVMIPVPSFSEYERAAEAAGSSLIFSGLPEKNNRHYLDYREFDILERGDSLVICSPNNPTGLMYDDETVLGIAEFCSFREINLVIDFSFADFVVGYDFREMMKKLLEYENVFMVYSLTKFFSLPGLRIGMLISGSGRMDRLKTFFDPWNVNSIAQAAGAAALEDREFMDRSMVMLEESKKYLAEKLAGFADISFKIPAANFFLLSFTAETDLDCLEKFLNNRKIFVRRCENFRGIEGKYLRIAVKEKEKSVLLAKALDDFYKEN